ncbi:hypothetical protein [Thermococcus sp. Bubb.Bath]|uniref:hypothetical protein n=1 Tax=Thermococcus sp. Bubb.Bath TaxID=1638242 RepID=UPI00143AEA3B|nr:hypothetical protein [Thermococcus sp. Bubb.Bath]NJF24559.1 hypothetical protein [Thermococcus sp. Bubb.Bath]
MSHQWKSALLVIITAVLVVSVPAGASPVKSEPPIQTWYVRNVVWAGQLDNHPVIVAVNGLKEAIVLTLNESGGIRTIFRYPFEAERVVPWGKTLLLLGEDGTVMDINPFTGKVKWSIKYSGGSIRDVYPSGDDLYIAESSANSIILLLVNGTGSILKSDEYILPVNVSIASTRVLVSPSLKVYLLIGTVNHGSMSTFLVETAINGSPIHTVEYPHFIVTAAAWNGRSIAMVGLSDEVSIKYDMGSTTVPALLIVGPDGSVDMGREYNIITAIEGSAAELAEKSDLAMVFKSLFNSSTYGMDYTGNPLISQQLLGGASSGNETIRLALNPLVLPAYIKKDGDGYTVGAVLVGRDTIWETPKVIHFRISPDGKFDNGIYIEPKMDASKVTSAYPGSYNGKPFPVFSAGGSILTHIGESTGDLIYLPNVEELYTLNGTDGKPLQVAKLSTPCSGDYLIIAENNGSSWKLFKGKLPWDGDITDIRTSEKLMYVEIGDMSSGHYALINGNRVVWTGTTSGRTIMYFGEHGLVTAPAGDMSLLREIEYVNANGSTFRILLNKSHLLPREASDAVISGAALADNSLILGVKGYGVAALNLKGSPSITWTKSIGGEEITDVASSEGRILVLTPSHLVALNPDGVATWALELKKPFDAIKTTKDGRILLLRKGTPSNEYIGVTFLLLDKDGRLLKGGYLTSILSFTMSKYQLKEKFSVNGTYLTFNTEKINLKGFTANSYGLLGPKVKVDISNSESLEKILNIIREKAKEPALSLNETTLGDIYAERCPENMLQNGPIKSVSDMTKIHYDNSTCEYTTTFYESPISRSVKTTKPKIFAASLDIAPDYTYISPKTTETESHKGICGPAAILVMTLAVAAVWNRRRGIR